MLDPLTALLTTLLGFFSIFVPVLGLLAGIAGYFIAEFGGLFALCMFRIVGGKIELV